VEETDVKQSEEILTDEKPMEESPISEEKPEEPILEKKPVELNEKEPKPDEPIQKEETQPTEKTVQIVEPETIIIEEEV
jgi:hypothetical protein